MTTPIAAMFSPGRCGHCGEIYDGGAVTVTARYSDCSVWNAPCCGRVADDRPRGWGGSFFPLSTDERARARRSEPSRPRAWEWDPKWEQNR